MYFSASAKASIMPFSSKRYPTPLFFLRTRFSTMHKIDIRSSYSCGQIMITTSFLGPKFHASKRLHHIKPKPDND